MTGYRFRRAKSHVGKAAAYMCMSVRCDAEKRSGHKKKPDDFVEQLTDAHAERTDRHCSLAMQRYALFFIRQRKKAEIFRSI